MAAALIGRCRCPVCCGNKARLTLAKTQLAVLTCNGCNLQIFARSGHSDEKLRELLIAEQDPAPLPAAAPEPAPAPAAAEPPAPPATPPAPAPKPKREPMSWGILRGT